MEENGKRYRLLNVGEQIEVGDEWQYRASQKWSKFLDQVYAEKPYITDPALNRAFPYGYYRRPIAEDLTPRIESYRQVLGRAQR